MTASGDSSGCDSEEARKQRAAARGANPDAWRVRRTTLDDHDRDSIDAEFLARTTPVERVAMIEPMTREAWALADLPWPKYDPAARENWPVRATRGLVALSSPSR